MKENKYLKIEDVIEISREIKSYLFETPVKFEVVTKDEKYVVTYLTKNNQYDFVIDDFRIKPLQDKHIDKSALLNDKLYEKMYEKYGYTYYQDYLRYWIKTFKQYASVKRWKNKGKILKDYTMLLKTHVNHLSNKIDYQKVNDNIEKLLNN